LNLGEFTLAHGGILFLDELSEFNPSSIQALREVLTHKRIEISRASGRISYPANFWFMGAFNLCDCGFLGHPVFPCVCSLSVKNNYLKKFQGPFMDRMDLQLGLSLIKPEMLNKSSELSTAKLKDIISIGRKMQLARLKKWNLDFNGDIPDSLSEKFLHIDENTWKEFQGGYLNNSVYSARELISVRKVARTIADMDGDEIIELEHLLEALSYKQFRKDIKLLHGDECYLDKK